MTVKVYARLAWGVPLAAVVSLVLLLLGAAPARAEGPRWGVLSSSAPTHLARGQRAKIVVIVSNLGDGDAVGAETPITITDKLPPGLHPVAVNNYALSQGLNREMACGIASSVTCTFVGPQQMAPYGVMEMRITVDVEEDAQSGEENEVVVAGGETSGGQEVPGASSLQPLVVGGAAASFGVERFELVPENEDGTVDTQAGSHPFQLTTTIGLNTVLEAGAPGAPELVRPVALSKDLHTSLPAGLVGNPTPVPQCTPHDFFASNDFVNLCPADTAVGVVSPTITEPKVIEGGEPNTESVPLFNLPPAVGEPARFGFLSYGVPVVLDTAVRTGADYGITVSSDNILETIGFLGIRLTFWGVPSDPRHDESRGWECLEKTTCQRAAASSTEPFLTLPTSCGEPFEASVEGDSWSAPGKASEVASPFSYSLKDSLGAPLALAGCSQLAFGPSISVAADGQAASTPTGLRVDVHVPQYANENSEGLDSSNVKDIAVTLPEGVTLSPSAADGLQACSEAQIGFQGFKDFEPGTQSLLFTGALPEPLEPGVNFCPEAAKVGTAKITSPLLPAGQPLEGSVYLAAPAPAEEEGQNPYRTLVAMYIVVRDPISGTLLKLPGKVTLDQRTGRISTSFENNPQLAFEDAELHFFGGERAPLSTPAHCGSYTTEATFTPWSGTAPIKSSSSFVVTSGPHGSACPAASLPFSPSLAAGSTSINAGSFSPLTTTVTREDGQQNIQQVTLHMPAGLSGMLAGVKLCGEAQANAGTCGPESRIGSTIVSVGLGGDPYSVTGGEVFLTEKVAGSPADAPFGLSIVNPAVAGPFNLGKVVVRATIAVDPHTAQLTITTGAIPHILDGIPLQIKHVNVTIDGAGGNNKFTFNPTSCDPAAIAGTVASVEGATAAVSTPFQVTNCAALKFQPKFAASTSGHTSKANGASLTVKLTYPNTPQGTEANIHSVKVDLPKQLPSRLTTLQKACTAAQFETNPAGCPAASVVGHARAITPILPVPLEGPAYFVSHGGEAFPSLIVVLQGYGVTVDLVGTTFISKAGITSSTFKSVPDVPVGSFELTLPEGRYSALGTNKRLCTQHLAMPTAFVAQNGAEIHESTKVAVTGCPKAKKAKKGKSKKRKGKATGKKK